MLSLRKRGRYWYARGTVPVRQTDGRIARVRTEESTREASKARARRVADDIARDYHEQAYRPKPKSISFTDAAITYVETKQPSKRDRQFLAKLVAHFGETPIADIDQASISNAAGILYPNRSASTHNRAVYAPFVTVARLSGFRPDIGRPRQSRKPINVPPDGWFDSVLPHCENRLAGLLIFLTLTGRRITETLTAELNPDGKSVTIPKTKTGESIVVEIPKPVRALLRAWDRNWVSNRKGRRLFPYGDRHNVYRELKPICKRLGIPYYGTHALGRHSFASRLLREGKSLKFVADAGGWKSARLVIDTYGHLEQREVQREAREVGERWGKRLKRRQKKAKNKD